MRLWSELRPDYVKLDKCFTQGIASDAAKQQFVRSIQAIAHATGARVIAEGIETADDLACLNGLGLGLGQGYHLGRPLAQPARARWTRGDGGAGGIFTLPCGASVAIIRPTMRESRPGRPPKAQAHPQSLRLKDCIGLALLQEALTKCSEAILARRVTADSTNKLRQGHTTTPGAFC